MTDADYRAELLRLMPDDTFLHARYVLDGPFEKQLTLDEKALKECVQRDLTYGLGRAILDKKQSAFRDFTNSDMNREFALDLIVFSPDEWRKYHSDLQTLLQHARYRRTTTDFGFL
jgi:hypothetical protein